MDFISLKEIENHIFTLRSKQVMLDSHLAEMYGVETKVFNQAIKRNIERFPDYFRFQITEEEWSSITSETNHSLRSQIVTLKNGRGQHRKYLPYAFTEQGVAMLSAVLHSETAIKVSIQIMNAFVEMRQLLNSNAALFQRLDKMELKQLEADQKFEQIFKALENRNQGPETGIFFDGQIFDAYLFIAELIRKAEKSIILIDNFIDETVLMLLSKRQAKVKASIYTKHIDKQLQLDLKKHNQQYPPIEIKKRTDCHDRFLILDEKELYHIGASLKDLGNKWFAFSKMDSLTGNILKKIKSNA